MIKYGSYGIQHGYGPRKQKHPLKYFLLISLILSALAITWFIAEYKYDPKKQLFTLTKNITIVLNKEKPTTNSTPVTKPENTFKKKPVIETSAKENTPVNNQTEEPITEEKDPEKAPLDDSVNTQNETNKFIQITLANGERFIAYKNGIESKLIYEIENPETAAPQPYVLDQASFEIDSYDLLPRAQKQIQNIFKILQNYDHVKVLISGHTDNIGKEEVNEYFSLRRAKSVRDLLIKYSIKRNRIRVLGKGESTPIAPNDSRINRSKNRRIDIKIIR